MPGEATIIDKYTLTKRELFAGELMAGMMRSYCLQEVDDMSLRDYAKLAVEGTDALIAELNKEQGV
jgi:hypothetical protein